jgi:prolyl-tRNA synthetase
MLHSKIFVKSKKEDPTDEVSKNAILLHKASYIYKEMAGVYSYLPFGLRTLTKIENLVRKHMDKIGNEIFMSSLAPKELWETTKRIDTVDVLFKASAANEFSKNKSGNEYILNSTHEELVTPIAIDFGKSYKDFPLAYYQIQTKFRNEPRAKSGLLRGREFRMKDLYSFHIDEQDFLKYYEEAKNAYMDFYHDVGLGEDTFIASASGGDFTQRFSHEFQTLVDAGEDVIYIDREKKVSYNKEVVSEDAQENIKNFGYDVSKLPLEKACEVGNIFPLESKFTKAFNFQYTDKDNQKKLVEYMGCYGIGPSRVMGVLVEKFGDDKGLVWPKSVAPFNIEIVSLHKEVGDEVYKKSESVYNILKNKFEVLFDDRNISVGQKLADADLYGVPVQIIVGAKNLEKNIIEVKFRKTGEVVELSTSLSDDDLLQEIENIWQKVF